LWSGSSNTSVAVEEVGLSGTAKGTPPDFDQLVEAHRTDLHAHCYRMLGSLQDADDALQDTLLRAWRGLPKFRGESSPRTWLYRIATNVCLDAIARRPRRVLPNGYGPATPPGAEERERRPLTEVPWIEPYPDEVLGVADGASSPEARYERSESLELAFIAALQHLPASQRSALVLCDVLGFSAKEASESLGTTIASVNGALRRARTALEKLPDQSQQKTLRALGDRRLRETAGRFADAFERGEVDTILAMLADDATFAMPPYPEWRRGRDAMTRSWLMPVGPGLLRYLPIRANGQLAFGVYAIKPDASSYLPIALDVLTLRGDLIVDVTAFRTPTIFPRFQLPDRLPAFSTL
jgi:RNA polymerase sigma-70 factor (ECF subfamily)